MANPIVFTPKPVDPRRELNRRLAAAPTEHAEALLVAWDLLQSAHDEGILDLLNGMVSAKDTIAGKLAEYAKLPEGVAAIRNLISLVKILGAFDPDTLDSLSESMRTAALEQQTGEKPPSLFKLVRRANSEDSRRGLAFLLTMLGGLGESLKR